MFSLLSAVTNRTRKFLQYGDFSWFLLYSDTEDEEKQVIPGRTIPASMHTYEFLDKDSMIQCEEIRAVSKSRLDANRGCIGALTPEDFNLVKGKFKRAYNL